MWDCQGGYSAHGGWKHQKKHRANRLTSNERTGYTEKPQINRFRARGKSTSWTGTMPGSIVPKVRHFTAESGGGWTVRQTDWCSVHSDADLVQHYCVWTTQCYKKTNIYILNKNINATLLFLLPFFMSWSQISKIHSRIHTISPFLSSVVVKSVKMVDSEHFYFAEIIYSTSQICTSRYSTDTMISAQVNLILPTIKAPPAVCSFYFIGVWALRTSQYHLPHAVQHLLHI